MQSVSYLCWSDYICWCIVCMTLSLIKFINDFLQKKPFRSVLKGVQLLKAEFLLKAATRGVLRKKVLLKISQNSQENTCTRVSFLIKLHTPGLQLYWKETLVQVFWCEFCEISRNTLFAEHLWTTASVTTKYNRIIIRNFHITAANMVWAITKTVEI